MDNLIFDAGAIGVLSSLITELIQLVPFLSKTDTRKRLVALVVSLAGTVYLAHERGMFSQHDWAALIGTFGIIIAAAFATYKSVIKLIYNS